MGFIKKTVRMWQPISLILFILVSEISGADNIPNFDLSGDTKLFSISSLYWEDTSKTATPSEAKVQLDDGELINNNFTVPVTDASYWFAFTLTNLTDHALSKSVYVDKPYLNKVNLHYQQQGKWVSELNGTDIVLNKRKVRNVLPIFIVSLGAHESRTFYVEAHSKIKLLQFNFNIDESDNSRSIGEIHATIVKMYIGAGLLVTLINVLMCLFFRDRVYIYYSAFTFSFIFATVAINSFDLFLNVQFQNRNLFLLSYLSVLFFLSLFIGEVLQTNKNMPWIEGALKISRLILVTIGIMTTFNESHVSYVLVATIPASMLFLPILVAASRQGAPYAKTLMVGVMLLISGAMTTVLVNKGVLPKNEVTVHGILIGSIAEMVIFSVTLFRRVIDSNAEAQSALSAMAEHASTKLENTVIARTRELNQAKQAAEQANENRRDFFSNINHEMRTPLNGILGIIGVIGQQDEKTVSARHFKTLKIAGHQLSHLVSNVLDHSRLSSNAALQIQPINFNILDIVNELEDIFYNMAEDKGLSLSFQVQGDLILDRHGDYDKLKRVLINIMGNAIKFTHSGRVELTILQGSSEDELMFSIADTGDGIAEAQIERIYTAYHQVPGSNGFQKTGSGLGLSISKTLTIVMGGTLNVKSELGKGTQFDLCLPLKPLILRHKKEVNINRAINPVNLSGKCILVADDSDINQEVVSAFLSSTGISVVAVTDGKQALDRFQLGGIDIVLMDLHMGVMDGITATSLIREFEANNNLEHCPIIFHTADTGEETLGQANEAGAERCLYKPYTQAKLLSTLYEFIDLKLDG